ncbi:MAG: hypothetical protein DRP56_00820 [Planctomycetota bacterium]|nr:MAG: hypothetical protein DRP56_00820 [Planctomycetota bacterium]
METNERYSAWLEGVRYCVYVKKLRTQVAIAEGIGIEKQSLNAILKRRKGKRASQRLQDEIAIAIGHTYEEMLSLGRHILDGNDPEGWRPISINVGIGVMSEAEKKKMGAKTLPRKIPIISWVQAGDWQDIVNEFHPGDADEFIPVFKNVSDGTFALRITGDSMAPEFLPGDIIIVDPSLQPETGKYIVAKIDNGNNENGEATFKQFIRDGNQIYLKPLNDKFDMMNMTGKVFRVVGCVVQKTKEY